MIKRKGALICGYYGNYNLGDEAMLAGTIKLLREQNVQPITVFSGDPQDTQTRHSVQGLNYRGQKFKTRYNLTILQNRYFILGGGDLLRDSVDSYIAQNWLRPLHKAIQLRCRTLVLGISVGEIWREETKALIPQVLNRVDLLMVRDAESKSKLEKLGVCNSIHIMSDLALELLPKSSARPICPTNRPIQIGIAIRSVSRRGRAVDVNVYPAFQQEIAAIADFLAQQYGAIVHFLPFQALKSGYRPTNDDYINTLEVLRYSRYSSQFVVHRYFETFQHLNQLISTFDLVIGMRLHALILAAGLGVPVIAAEYDPKVRGFMEEIGRAEYSIPLECFKQKRILPVIETILSDPLAARKDVEAGVDYYRKRTLGAQQALAEVLTKG